VLTVVVFLVGGQVIDGFTDISNVRSLLVIASLLGIASVGQTLAVLVGGIDLSIPALMGFANVMSVELYGRGWSFAIVIVVLLASAGLVGAASGLSSKALGAHPLIITLAVASIVTGAVLAYTQGGEATQSLPSWIGAAVSPAGHTGPLAVPGVVVAWAVISVVLVALQRGTVFGRHLYATGANPTAASLALVRTTRVWVVCFALSAVFAAIGGILLGGLSGGASNEAGDPYLFLTISAVVVGGTSLLGGRGGYGRTIGGVLLLTVLTTLLVGVGVDDEGQKMLLGGLIVVVVAIYGREASVRNQI
jgi:ribose transport system permease protein